MIPRVAGPGPVIALTMGDPAGVGPEIILRALDQEEVARAASVVVVGDPGILAKAARVLGLSVRINPVQDPARGLFQKGVVDLVPASSLDPEGHCFGLTDPTCGQAAYQAVVKAVEMVRAGRAEAVCTAPLAKSSLQAAGHLFPGHTELLGRLSGGEEPVMCLAGPKLKVSLVTTHAPLSRIPGMITTPKVLRTARLTHEFLVRLGCERPRLAVCGLNPHAGEGGLFGTEDQEVVAPAVAEAKAAGLDLSGPEPGDTVFHRAAEGEFDGVVALYHDQGLAPFKLIHFKTGVNVTLGLPLIRTSVGHGTAFDLAGRGRADPASLISALKLAAALARPKERRKVWD